MKWSELPILYRVISVAGFLCIFGYAALAAASLAGILPSVYDLPAGWALWGGAWVSLGITNWKTRRKIAVLPFAIAILSFVMTIVTCVA